MVRRLETAMNEDFKFFGLTPLFGAIGAVATAAAWHIFAFTLLNFVPAPFAVLSCLVVGLSGPVAVWATVWILTRRQQTLFTFAVRRAASVGLGIVFAAELGFYIPLGFFAMAFHS